jgi:hypothetical protein
MPRAAPATAPRASNVAVQQHTQAAHGKNKAWPRLGLQKYVAKADMGFIACFLSRNTCNTAQASRPPHLLAANLNMKL